MPFPSRGCRTCRQRRLKCDETRPICGQCKKSSRICLGFEVEQDTLPFRSENAFASGVARRPRRITTNETRKALNSSRSTSRSRGDHDTTLQQIPRSPELPLEDVALHCYIRSHLLSAEFLPPNMHYLIEQLILTQQAASDDSLLPSVVSAASLAIFGRTRYSTEALMLGNRKYIRALAKMKAIINDANDALTDQFLLSVMMLAVYEHAVCNYDKRFILAESFRHQSGAITILKLRKALSQSATSLDMVVRRLIIKQAVLHAVSLPDWIQDGSEFGEEGVQLEMDTCTVKLALLRHRAQEFWRDSSVLDSESLQIQAESLLEQARTVDQMLTVWASSLPQEWTFTIQENPSLDPTLIPSIEVEDPDRLQYRSAISVYPNNEQVCTWNRYRASRMITQRMIMMTLPFTAPHGLIRAQQLAARETIQECIDEICASVPYHFDMTGTNSENQWTTKPRLDKFSARKVYMLAWPLTIARTCSTIPENQRQWIRSKILLISRITGNSSLELVANMDRNINLRGDTHDISKQRLKESVQEVK